MIYDIIDVDWSAFGIYPIVLLCIFRDFLHYRRRIVTNSMLNHLPCTIVWKETDASQHAFGESMSQQSSQSSIQSVRHTISSSQLRLWMHRAFTKLHKLGRRRNLSVGIDPAAATNGNSLRPLRRSSWENIQPGHVIVVKKGEIVPADLIVLCTSSRGMGKVSSDPSLDTTSDVGKCEIDTQYLDGVTRYQSRQSIPQIQNAVMFKYRSVKGHHSSEQLNHSGPSLNELSMVDERGNYTASQEPHSVPANNDTKPGLPNTDTTAESDSLLLDIACEYTYTLGTKDGAYISHSLPNPHLYEFAGK